MFRSRMLRWGSAKRLRLALPFEPQRAACGNHGRTTLRVVQRDRAMRPSRMLRWDPQSGSDLSRNAQRAGTMVGPRSAGFIEIVQCVRPACSARAPHCGSDVRCYVTCKTLWLKRIASPFVYCRWLISCVCRGAYESAGQFETLKEPVSLITIHRLAKRDPR